MTRTLTITIDMDARCSRCGHRGVVAGAGLCLRCGFDRARASGATTKASGRVPGTQGPAEAPPRRVPDGVSLLAGPPPVSATQ